MANILIADDEELMRKLMSEALGQTEDNIIMFDPEKDYDNIPQESLDVALIDIYMPNISGFKLHKKLLEYSPDMETIFISGMDDENLSEDVVEVGGYTFLTKPFTPTQIKSSVKAALYIRNLKSNKENVSNLCVNCGADENELCSQPENVRAFIDVYGPMDIPVLISGESGSGKEVVAHCIHKHSERRKNDMVSLNCAALSPSLIESELFGHKAGSFTGASKNKAGYFEVADNGTLFLDEIGELPLELQAKLLRVLDRNEIVPVGSTTPKKINVRVISATNRNLVEMINRGEFRSDLYYRLHGAEISLKPLREQKDRIPFLASLFINGSSCTLTNDGANYLASLEWEGNIRELRTVCEILKSTCNSTITKNDIKRLISSIGIKESGIEDSTIETYQEFKDHIVTPREKEYFESLLTKYRGNISQVSRVSGISRRHLYDKLSSFGLI